MEFFNIQEELKKIPDSPGVYLMHNEQDEIIYIGKAVCLKNRVRQYFQSSRNKSTKILRMVSQIHWFEYILTDSELEALVLENNLIKEHQPRYNTMLKDDKTYPYIKVTMQEAYPRILFARERKKDRARYFGPYTSSESVKSTIDLLNKLFQIRTCHKALDGSPSRQRPCLNAHLGQCTAPCQGAETISREAYQKQIEQALDFLEGRNHKQIEQHLKERMQKAAAEMDFEKAAQIRDLLFAVQKIEEKQKITAGNQHKDRDIIALAADRFQAVVQVFFIRDGKMIGRDHFRLTAGEGDSTSQILNDFVKQFYAGTPYIPSELLLMEPIADRAVIEKWLTERKGSKVSCCVPQKGEKVKLIELAAKNARLVLKQGQEKVRREQQRTIGACAEIASLLSLPQLHRIEAFDISNISGFESVGSMIVFEDGKSRRNDYRKFRIRSVSGPDDYASMKEVLTRRFLHGIEEQKQHEETAQTSFSRFPDLIMMDGGKGQVNIALSVLDELGLSIPVCGMVKDDHHNTRGLYFQNVELEIDTHSEGFRLITRIQDEAHRFAIEYHRSLRSRTQVHSILDEIKGIGPTRRKTLMKHYPSLEQIRNATPEELAALPGMNQKAAENVYAFFHSETKQSEQDS